MTPKISIIVPVYNVENYIEDCLKSIFSQTYPNIEIVLIDDCSPDNSIENSGMMLESLRSKFEVQVHRNEQNRGLSFTRNRGVQIATGDYIYFLDSDDILDKLAIEVLVQSIQNAPNNINFAIGNIRTEGKKKNFAIDIPPYLDSNEQIMRSFLLGKWYVMGVNKLIERKFFIENNLWFQEGLLHEDILFSFRLASCAHSMSSVCTQTYIYKIRDNGSITTNVSIKNLRDELSINDINFATLRTSYKTDNTLPIYYYCSQTTYVYLFLLASCEVITYNDKSQLRQRALLLLRSMKPYSCGSSMDFGSKIKHFIISLPLSCSFALLRLHKKLIKIK